MERIFEAIKNAVSAVFGYIVAAVGGVLFGILSVFYIPVDYVRYKRSAYYKKERKKYSAFATTSVKFQFYNDILENELPIEYIPDPKSDELERGCFLYNGILLMPEKVTFYFDPTEEEWGWWNGKGSKRKLLLSLDKFLEFGINDVNRLAGKEICNRGVVVICEKDIENNLELARTEPRFLLYDDSRMEALKRFCQENA